MNADSTPTERDDVAAVLAAHESRAQNLDGDWMCACGSFLCPPNDDRLDRAHREHIAKVIERVVIAAREQAARAEALRQGEVIHLGVLAQAQREARAAALREAADDFPHGVLAADPSVPTWLRARADRIEDHR